MNAINDILCTALRRLTYDAFRRGWAEAEKHYGLNPLVDDLKAADRNARAFSVAEIPEPVEVPFDV